MNRREFLVRLGGISLLVILPEVLSGCGSSDLTITSDADSSGHTHTIVITKDQLSAAAAYSSTTSTSSGHAHTIALSASQMASVAAGTSVQVTSGTASGHTHTFTVTK